MRRMTQRLLIEETGQDLIEYALLAALLATLSITALSFLGHQVEKLFMHVAGVFPPAA